MAARIIRFSYRPSALKREDAAQVRQMLLALEPDAPQAVGEVLALLDREHATANGWSFVMLGPEQNRIVLRWILDHAKRQRVSTALWAEFFCHMRRDTGEIIMSREAMAKAVGVPPRTVSECLTELLGMGALIRCQQGRVVRWFMNPRVGTCLTGTARDSAQRSAPRLVASADCLKARGATE